MRIFVIGSGGREHALVWKIGLSPQVSKLYCAPGNPGIGGLAECVPISSSDTDRLLEFATANSIDLTVVGPEQPLALGIVNLFEQHGLPIFGPTKNAARLEWSKGFAKEFMVRHHIPTAAFRSFSQGELAAAIAFVRTQPLPLVLKADGLAAGKGVIICRTHDEAIRGLEGMLHAHAFGPAGDTVVIEEFMEGEEASVFAVSDGRSFVTLAPAQDHKRVFDGDRGKNTGGMGAYASASIVPPQVMQEVVDGVIVPTLRGMREEGYPYKGCLYVGLMLTPRGVKVVEYNSRFGDPETQVVLPLYEGDLAGLLAGSAAGKLDVGSVPPVKGSAACIVLASGGYPDAFTTGHPIDGLEEAERLEHVMVFHGGTAHAGGRVTTAGGRVLAVTAWGANARLEEVIRSAYGAVAKISFAGMHFRRDIGSRGLRGSFPAEAVVS